MRLRRETGDFSIKFSQDGQPVYIPKDLKPADLIGAIIETPTGTCFAVVAVTKPLGENLWNLETVGMTSTFLYDASTGEVTRHASGT